MGSPDKVQSWGLMLALLQNGHCSHPFFSSASTKDTGWTCLGTRSQQELGTMQGQRSR